MFLVSNQFLQFSNFRDFLTDKVNEGGIDNKYINFVPPEDKIRALVALSSVEESRGDDDRHIAHDI